MLFKLPAPADGRLRLGERAKKADTRWRKGINLMRNETANEWVFGTESGIQIARIARRLLS